MRTHITLLYMTSSFPDFAFETLNVAHWEKNKVKPIH